LSQQFIDFQNDVTSADVALAVREGFDQSELLKRYTTAGMGTDQGKTGNLNTLGVLGRARAVALETIGTTTFRPPFTPLTFGAIAGADAGELFEPVRKTPVHPWHEKNGAVFEDVGQWKRPWYFPRSGESMRDAVNRECKAARAGIGILDASTLGKIDIQGADAAEFIDRIYCNNFRNLAIGRCRYGLMLRQDGMVFDDGVTARLGEQHYLMSTTTGGAARVLAWLEEWLQTEWPDLRVYCTSVTEQYAQVALSGPCSAELLGPLTDVKLDAMPFMSVREGRVAGIPARVFRISFSGAPGYEIAVPAGRGYELWTTLIGAGERFGITPYGTEAMHVLRAEKGFIVGHETDGSVTPIDLGAGCMLAREKPSASARCRAAIHCV
jgi:sarcosine oxidase subunit alpha